MKRNLSYLLPGAFGAASALTACPLDALSYPAPTNLSSDPGFDAVKTTLNKYLDQVSTTAPGDRFTFSVSVFSASEDDLAYQYHYTSPFVKNSTYGTHDVDADSIYRIGSISKLLTIYLFLINAGDKKFGDAITEYLPELKEYAAAASSVTSIWDDITLGDLAGQMAGLSRDFGLADIAQPKNSLAALPPSIAKAFPEVPEKDIPQCAYLEASGNWVACSEEDYMKGVAVEAPIFKTAYTPVYSNEAFALIGFALEKIAGLSMETLFNKTYIDALGLPNTYYTVPASGPNDIRAGPESWNNWASELGTFNPVGGYFSTTNDIAAIGRSMLNNKILSDAVTRRWMKPSGFVENHDQAVGRPWEIFRRPANGQSIEVYGKGGDWGNYHTFFGVIPQYDIGFSVFTSQDPNSDPNASLLEGGIPNKLLDTILPAIDNIAKKQAAATFAGRYTSTSGSTNSSLTISTDSTESGLLVTEWISNGVDLLDVFVSLGLPNLVYRILPNELYSGNKVGFTSFYESAEGPSNGTWYWECPGWVDVDELTHGNIPVGQMVFNVGADGKASSVDLSALRITLDRAS